MAGAIYVAITIVGCVVLALPGITFAVFAGLIFGSVLGTALCSFATTIGAALAFLVGRFFLKDSVKPMVEKNKYLKKLLFDESGKNEIVILMITRLVPIFPYNLQNFAYGITDIHFWQYTLFSFIFMLPGTALFTVGTAGLTSGGNKWIYLVVVVLLAVFVFGMGYWLKKKYIKGD
ncbi:MAG: VTT domain-containing protein [Lachnoclostridium sp.]